MHCDIYSFSVPIPIQLGDWINIEECQASGTNKSCGPGKLSQNRTCIDGTTDKCESHILEQKVACHDAKASLPDCQKIFSSWRTSGPCLATGTNKSCGPGLSLQERTCTNGTVNKCSSSRYIRSVSCENAGNPLPNCPRIISQWKNTTSCKATGHDKTCGPGFVILNRNCTDGTYDLCQNIPIQKNVSCVVANIPLSDCSGTVSFGDM